jgi:hypothetical protein
MPILEGFLLWAVVIVLLGLIMWEVVWDYGIGATVTALAGAALLWYFTGAVNLVPWIKLNWVDIVMWVGIYLALGVPWAIFEWWLYLHEEGDRYEKLHRKDLQARWDAYNENQKSLHGSFKEYVRENGFPPDIRQHKADFTMWMAWWPFCFVWFVTGRAVKKFWNFVYTKIGNMLERMSNAVFGSRFTELQ